MEGLVWHKLFPVESLLQAELEAHLNRLALWSVVWLLAGVVVGIRANRDRWRLFGWTSAAWCTVNLAIVLASRLGSPPDDLVGFREFLWLNIGLNVGYAGVGLALWLVARHSEKVRGAGLAVIIQGLFLLIVDIVLLQRLPVPSLP